MFSNHSETIYGTLKCQIIEENEAKVAIKNNTTKFAKEIKFKDLFEHVEDIYCYKRHNPGIYINDAIFEEELKLYCKIKKRGQR